MKNILYPCFNWPGSVWIYSDPHFADPDVQYFRPESATDEEQIKRINKTVSKSDTLVILGDIGELSFVKRLKAGHKVLIKGNHDSGISNYKRSQYTSEIACEEYLECSPNSLWLKAAELFPKDEDSQRNYVDRAFGNAWEKAVSNLREHSDFIRLSTSVNYDLHPPFITWTAYYDNRLFDEVYEGCLLINEKIILSHEPVDFEYAFNIHGHDHSGADFMNHVLKYYDSDMPSDKMLNNYFDTIKKDNLKKLNVCAEWINYTPVNLNWIYKQGLLHNIIDIHRKTIDIASNKK